MRIMCLHANLNNAKIIDQGLHDLEVDFVHVVDDRLIEMIRQHETEAAILLRVQKQVERLLKQKPDFILITCTNYILFLDKLEISSSIPILKIDELLFSQLPDSDTIVQLLFTNQETVAGTVARFQSLYPSVETNVRLIEKAFDHYLAGDIRTHDLQISQALAATTVESQLVAAQLSMSPAVEIFNQSQTRNMLHPLDGLRKYFSETLRNYNEQSK